MHSTIMYFLLSRLENLRTKSGYCQTRVLWVQKTAHLLQFQTSSHINA